MTTEGYPRDSAVGMINQALDSTGVHRQPGKGGRRAPRPDTGRRPGGTRSRLGIVVLWLFVLSGLGLVAWGIFGGTAEEHTAPMPETLFSATDPDTFIEADTGFVPSLKGPMVSVPSLSVEAELVATDVQPDGYLALPDPPLATWYQRTVPFGSTAGRSLIASHVDNGVGDAAPFSQLHKIAKGAPVMVRDFKGRMHYYKATSIEVYERQAVPEDVFSAKGEHQLVLVTCSGPTVDSGRAAHYLYNLVVIADEVEDPAGLTGAELFR